MKELNSINSLKISSDKKQGQDTKKQFNQQLFNALYTEPLSRRMVATNLGYPDMTYLVTQTIFDWIESNKAQVVGVMKCTRSGRRVQFVTTNPELFEESDQLNLFEV